MFADFEPALMFLRISLKCPSKILCNYFFNLEVALATRILLL